MHKCTLASAISLASAAVCQPALAAGMTCNVAGGTNNGIVYTTTAVSKGISVVVAGGSVAVYYVNDALPVASDPAATPVTLTVNGDWCIDQATGAFTGNVAYGNYKTQANSTAFPVVDGRQTYVNANQAFSGVGTRGTNGSGLPTLSFSYFNTTTNGGGASTYTATSTTCLDGVTNLTGKICSHFVTASRGWEGLNFQFTFDAAYYSFTGALTGTDTSGSGPRRQTSTINWNIAGVDPPAVPLPAPAWLFGSALLGLGAVAGRRKKICDAGKGIIASNR